uniref:Uncharacterized protein n=1 Tax=Arundo donax TaxID=35708 RepID=A0A0A8ZI47_ARUDO
MYQCIPPDSIKPKYKKVLKFNKCTIMASKMYQMFFASNKCDISF